MNVESIATLLNINKNEKGEYPFKIVDSKSDLGIYMIHYDVDTINETKVDDIARQLRGVIVSDNKGIIVPSFGYTPTIICDVYPEKDEILKDKDGNEYSLPVFDVKDVFPMFDGTLLRVWKYNGNIFISSHKKIDASNSRWGTSGKFVELFKKYTESTFKVEDLFPADSSESIDGPIQVHNFLLVDEDLLIASKLKFKNSEEDKDCSKSGFVVYVNSLNCELPIELPKVDYNEIGSCEHTVMKVNSLKSKEECNMYLQKGFSSDVEEHDKHISLGEGIILYNGKSMLKMVSNGYNRRSKIVDNDPNILHRVYEILTESAFPKDGVDTYLEKYPAIPCPTEEQIESFKGGIIDKFPEEWKVYSDQELTETNDRETRERRFRNAVVHYAISLPLSHQKWALKSIDELLTDRYKAVQIVCNDYEKFAKGDWGEVYPRDLKVYERIKAIVLESKKFAKARVDKGERLEGKTINQTLRKFAIDSIRNLMFKEYGVSIYKIVRVLVSDPKKKEE